MPSPTDDRKTRPPAVDRTARTAAVRSERAELLDHLTAALDPLMAVLGLVFLVLLLLDYAGRRKPDVRGQLDRATVRRASTESTARRLLADQQAATERAVKKLSG